MQHSEAALVFLGARSRLGVPAIARNCFARAGQVGAAIRPGCTYRSCAVECWDIHGCHSIRAVLCPDSPIPTCAKCRAGTRVRCARLSIQAATRVRSLMCGPSNHGVCRLELKFTVLWRYLGDGRALSPAGAGATGHTFRFVRRSGGISVNSQRRISQKSTSGLSVSGSFVQA